jgi:hypothetical protein
MEDSLGELMTAELSIYWALDGKDRRSPKRKDYTYNIPVAAAVVFLADTLPHGPPLDTRLHYIDDCASGLVTLLKQFH